MKKHTLRKTPKNNSERRAKHHATRVDATPGTRCSHEARRKVTRHKPPLRMHGVVLEICEEPLINDTAKEKH